MPPKLALQPEGATLDRLMDASASLFWSHGFAVTTTRQIAAASGIQQASLYYYVKSKEELLYKIFASSLDLFQEQIAKFDTKAGTAGLLRALIIAHVSLLLKYQKRNAVMVTELRTLTGNHRRGILEQRKQYGDAMRAALESAQTAGVLRSDIPARFLNLALLNLLNWSCIWYIPGRDVATEELGERFFSLLMEGVLTPAARPGLDLASLRSMRAVNSSAVNSDAVNSDAVNSNEDKLQYTAPHRRKTASAAAKAAAKGSGKAVEKNDTRLRMLKTAAALFAQKGYHLTNTREIAEGLGIQKASLYYHIDAKEDLLFEICRASIERIQQEVSRAMAGIAEPIERLRRLIGAHVLCVLEDQDMHAASLADISALSEERGRHVAVLRERYHQLLRSELRAAQRKGAVRQDLDLKYLSLGLLGLMDRVQLWYRPGRGLSPAQIAELVSAVFLGGSRATV